MLKRNYQGTTLIELMAVIAIIGIMTTVFLVVFSKNNRTQKELEVEARKVLAAIEETRNFSLTGKNAGSSCGNVNTFNYGPGEIYYINGCNSVAYNLENGVSFSGSGTVSFAVPHGNLSWSGGGSVKDIDLVKNEKHYHICVQSSGRIELSGSNPCVP